MGDDVKPDPTATSGKLRALAMAAYARIASEGFEGLRTRDVAADVGVNIGTLHYYFPSKEALIRGAADCLIARYYATVTPEGSAADQLRAHLENLRRLLKADPEMWAVSSEISLRSARDDAIAEVVKDATDHWHAIVREMVARGVAEGVLPGDLEPDGAAAALVGAIRGLSMPPTAVARPERIDQAIDQLERWLGLRPTLAPDPSHE